MAHSITRHDERDLYRYRYGLIDYSHPPPPPPLSWRIGTVTIKYTPNERASHLIPYNRDSYEAMNPMHHSTRPTALHGQSAFCAASTTLQQHLPQTSNLQGLLDCIRELTQWEHLACSVLPNTTCLVAYSGSLCIQRHCHRIGAIQAHCTALHLSHWPIKLAATSCCCC